MNAEQLETILAPYGLRLYSGRGMYGRQCWSITTEGGQSPIKLLADVIVGCEDLDQAAELLRRATTDDMGRNTVIYWPTINIHAEMPT